MSCGMPPQLSKSMYRPKQRHVSSFLNQVVQMDWLIELFLTRSRLVLLATKVGWYQTSSTIFDQGITSTSFDTSVTSTSPSTHLVHDVIAIEARKLDWKLSSCSFTLYSLFSSKILGCLACR